MKAIACLLLIGVVGCTTPGGHIIDKVVEERTLGGAGIKPSVAVDRLNQPHIVVLKNEGGSTWDVYDKVLGSWQSETVNLSGFWSPAGSWNNPHIEIDKNDRAWVSGIMVVVGNYNGCGIGVLTRGSVSSEPSSFDFKRLQMIPPPGWATGNLSVYDDKAVVWVNMGRYALLEWNGGIKQVDDGSSLFAGVNLGERPTGAFRVAADGTEHVAYGGHPNLAGMKNGGYLNSDITTSVPWNNSALYNGTDEDNFTGLAIDRDDPRRAYIAIDSHQGYLLVNFYDGQKMLYDVDAPLKVSGTSSYPLRWPVQLSPAIKGGAWLCYVSGGKVTLKYLARDGKSNGNAVQIDDGSNPTVVTDHQGHLHLVYMSGGSVKYKKIQTK